MAIRKNKLMILGEACTRALGNVRNLMKRKKQKFWPYRNANQTSKYLMRNRNKFE